MKVGWKCQHLSRNYITKYLLKFVVEREGAIATHRFQLHQYRKVFPLFLNRKVLELYGKLDMVMKPSPVIVLIPGQNEHTNSLNKDDKDFDVSIKLLREDI